MPLRVSFPLLAFLLTLVAVGRVAAEPQPVPPCAVGSGDSAAFVGATNLKFHYYKVPFSRGQRANRDFEFLWSDTYRSRYGLDLDDATGGDQLADLDRLGRVVCDRKLENPLRLDMYDIEIAYNYLAQRRTQSLAQRDTLYQASPDFSIGFRVATNYPDIEENHVDAYIYTPDHGAGGGFAAYAGDQAIYNGPSLANSRRGACPPDFRWWAAEDSATGNAGSQAYGANAVSIAGPPPWKVGSQDATPWTRAGGTANTDLIHESLHAINGEFPSTDDAGRITFLHVFARAAEILTGAAVDRASYELDYTASLWPDDSNEPNSYPHWLSFAAYIAFNFRGADTLAANYEDDLLRRWATRGGSNKLAGLAGRLKDSECPECSGYPEFVGRDSVGRLQRLIHNWRVANYVNNSSLPGGRYGYPAGYGFSPNYQLRAWESFDGSATDDTVSVPPITTLSAANRNQLLRYTDRPGTGGSPPRRLELDMFGAEYWVFKADPSLHTTQQNLSVRVRAAKLMKGSYVGDPVDWNPCERADYSGRLTASVITYSTATDDLYLHPELATGVTTQEVVLDRPNQDIVLDVPGFGGPTRAVVVVVTLGDGPEGTYALGNWPPKLPGQPRTYPIELMAMLVAENLPMDPFALAATPRVETSPAWSPAGDSLAFEGLDASGARRIYVAAAAQGASSRPLVAGSAAQYDPAWSPRDRSIAYTQASSGGRRDLWLIPPAGPTAQLTSMPGVMHDPAFSPSGDRIAYVRCVRTHPPADDTTLILPPSQWTWSSEIRIRILATGEDFVLSSSLGDSTIASVRWTPDGRHLYFRATDELGAWRLWRIAMSSTPSWIPADTMAPGALAFDFAPGRGKLLVVDGQIAQWEPFCTAAPAGCPPCGSGQTFRSGALGLRDTLSGLVTGITQEVGFPVPDARWSPDGTRVALTVDQAGNPDVHVVKTTSDRAPVFSSSVQSSYSVPSCAPVELILSATDPDGDAVTFEVFDLPAGAQLQSGSHIYWPSPAAGQYWLIARALDPQGAVATRLIRLEVFYEQTCGGEGGEDPPPILPGGNSARQADSNRLIGGDGPIRVANTVLDGAPNRQWVEQIARLMAPSVDSTGHVSTRIAALRPGVLQLDRVRLLVAEHAPGAVAVATASGVAIGARREPAHIVTGDGETVGSTPGTAADGARLFAAGSTLEVEWAPADTLAGLLLDCARAGAPDPDAPWGVEVQSRDAGAWQAIGRIQPRSGYDVLGLPLASREPVRIVFLTGTYVRGIGGYGPPASAAGTVTAVGLSGASVENGVEHLAAADTVAVELAQGQRVTMLFDGPPPQAGLQRTHFLDLTGRVERSGVAGASSGQVAEDLPVHFALHGNRPNPFGRGTTIRFDVPTPVRVRLEVFDAQGRRVRTLADRTFEPGEHSIAWDGGDASGQRVRPGVYLYRVTAGEFREQRRMVLLGR